MVNNMIDEMVNKRYPKVPGHQKTETSRSAAQSAAMISSGMKDDIIVWLRGRRAIGGTPDEFAEATGANVITARARFTDLKQLGHIRETGQTRKNKHGNAMNVLTLRGESNEHGGSDGRSDC